MTTPRHPRQPPRGPIAPIPYAPPSGYRLDLEVYSAAELRRRAQAVDLSGIERLQFHFVIHVSAGRYRHMVDFETHACTAGSVLVMQPGQAVDEGLGVCEFAAAGAAPFGNKILNVSGFGHDGQDKAQP